MPGAAAARGCSARHSLSHGAKPLRQRRTSPHHSCLGGSRSRRGGVPTRFLGRAEVQALLWIFACRELDRYPRDAALLAHRVREQPKHKPGRALA